MRFSLPTDDRSRARFIGAFSILSYLSFWAVPVLAQGSNAQDPAESSPVVVEVVINREAPQLNPPITELVAGRDGRVYLSCLGNGTGYFLSMKPDGSDKRGQPLGHAEGVSAVNDKGVCAHRLVHFGHMAAFFAADNTRLGSNTEFDNSGFDAPQSITVGTSGDFFALDRMAKRIVRLDSSGKVSKFYAVPDNLAKTVHVCEAKRLFIVESWTQPRILMDFDGKVVSQTPLPAGPLAIQDDGTIYSISYRGSDVMILMDSTGNKTGEVKLDLGDRKTIIGSNMQFSHLALLGDEVLLKRDHPTELFARYDRKTGEFKGSVSSDHELLRLTLKSDILTAGQTTPLKVDFESGSRQVKPIWRVWARPFGAPGWRELTWNNDVLQVPADYAGLYQLKVSDTTTPLARGNNSEYLIETIVEVRAKDSKGTVSVLTQDNRVYYGGGESVFAAVIIRAAQTDSPKELTVQLREGGGETTPGKVVHEQKVAAPSPTTYAADPAVPVAWPTFPIKLPGTLTKSLRPGPYVLTVSAPKLTCIAQPLVIGPGELNRKFWRMLHADMGNFSIGEGTLQRTPDAVLTWKETLERLGFNAIVERLGSTLHQGWFVPNQVLVQSAAWRLRLAKDPLATAPQKVMAPTPTLQCAGAYSALGLALMPILLYNDAGLPLGAGFDARKDDELTADIARVTKALDPYSCFYGWSWAANWWNFDGSIKLPAAEKSAFDVALKNANETGAWDPILDKGFDIRLAYNDDAIQRMTKMFQQAASREKSSYKTAVASPYRRIDWHSPMNFAAVDEVDLHYQCEQIPAPFYMMHQVDWYRRPGKRAWGHVEVYNESGTGEQMLGACLMMLMRAPDGVGVQSGMPTLFTVPLNTVDSRVSTRGAASVLQAMNRLLEQLGPLLAAAENADSVAIVVSSRMNRSDQGGGGFMSRHFGRLANAYMSCLANHTPASFVYTEDLPTNSLKKYKAVLVIDQLYQMEPPLLAALKDAQGAGVKVFCDQTCRPELVSQFIPVGVGFTQFDDNFGSNHQDIAYRLMPQRIAVTADVLKQHLGFIRNSQPRCDNPEVYISTRRSGKTTYIIAVNNTMVPLDFGRMWRATLFSSTRLPVVADVTLPADLAQKPMYDMMSQQKLNPTDGKVRLDLRSLPMRIIAVTDEAPRATDQPIDRRFGPHLRDAAVSADGSTILFNAMNWDDNVYALNVANGQARFQGKVGGYFAFAPLATANGFYVQGFDFDASEGYHLYQLGADGKSQRRFALYGIANRLPFRFVPHLIQDRINNFTAAPDGSWVACSGDLGLAVWNFQGQLLWKADDWKDAKRQPKLLYALDAKTLLAASNMTLRAYPAGTRSDKAPAPLWEQTLANTDEIRSLHTDRDGKTIAAMTTFRDGSVTILRDGRIEQTLPCSGVSECRLTDDGARLAIVQDSRLSVISLADGARWTFHGDSLLHMPRFSPDGRRLVVSSEYGTLSILNSADGTLLHGRDLQAVAVPVWLPAGDLIVGDWMGHVTRLGTDFKTVWQAQVAPANMNVAAALKVSSELATISIKDWGDALPKPLVNAEQLAKAPNLLRPVPGQGWDFRANFMSSGRLIQMTRAAQPLFDGSTAVVNADKQAPGRGDDAFLDWNVVESFTEGSPENWLEVDAVDRVVRLEAITFFENPERPDSWLRDLKLEKWDFENARWVSICPLLSNAAVHSHKLPTPAEATRFRLLLPGGFSGNLRLSELVFHGKDMGPSHPDARARKPVAVLFDDNVGDLRLAYEHGHNPGFALVSTKDAYSGTSFISFTPTPGKAVANPHYKIPHWALDIQATPKPGTYRFLQFACRALAKETTKITLLVEGANPIVVDKPKEDWQVIRVDLWKLSNGRPFTARSLWFGSEGGPAAFDQILLGRTMNDLKNFSPPPAK